MEGHRAAAAPKHVVELPMQHCSIRIGEEERFVYERLGRRGARNLVGLFMSSIRDTNEDTIGSPIWVFHLVVVHRL